MKIELREISVREVTDGYINNQEDGVVGYGVYSHPKKTLKSIYPSVMFKGSIFKNLGRATFMSSSLAFFFSFAA